MMFVALTETTFVVRANLQTSSLSLDWAIVRNMDDSERGILREDPTVKWHQTLTPEKPRE